MKALLKRENLIQSLGVVEQIIRMLHPNHRSQKALYEYRCQLQPRNFNWIRYPATLGPCALSMKKSGRLCFPSARVRLTSQGQAIRRLEAINRALAGSVPPSLIPKQGCFLQPERVVSGLRTERALPSVANGEPRAAKAWGLCPPSAPLMPSMATFLDISYHR